MRTKTVYFDLLSNESGYVLARCSSERFKGPSYKVVRETDYYGCSAEVPEGWSDEEAERRISSLLNQGDVDIFEERYNGYIPW